MEIHSNAPKLYYGFKFIQYISAIVTPATIVFCEMCITHLLLMLVLCSFCHAPVHIKVSAILPCMDAGRLETEKNNSNYFLPHFLSEMKSITIHTSISERDVLFHSSLVCSTSESSFRFLCKVTFLKQTQRVSENDFSMCCVSTTPFLITPYCADMNIVLTYLGTNYTSGLTKCTQMLRLREQNCKRKMLLSILQR